MNTEPTLLDKFRLVAEISKPLPSDSDAPKRKGGWPKGLTRRGSIRPPRPEDLPPPEEFPQPEDY